MAQRLAKVALAMVVLAVLLGIDIGINATRVDDTAFSQVRSDQPQAQWTLVKKSFVLSSSDVEYGTMRIRGGHGPAWVVELSAPGDQRWNHYIAVVEIDPFDGRVSAASVSAYNDQ